MSGALEKSDSEAAAVQKTPNRVTLEYMKSRVKDVEYINPKSIPALTIAIVLYDNGYSFVGKSAPADAGNFDEALGRKFAYEDALRQIWPVEGFALRERLHNA